MPILKFTRVRCLGHGEVGQGTAYDEEPSDSMVKEVLLPLMTRPDALVLSYKAIEQCTARGPKTTNTLLLTGAGAGDIATCSTLGKNKAFPSNFGLNFFHGFSQVVSSCVKFRILFRNCMCTVDAEMAGQILGSDSGPKPEGDVRLQVSGSNLKVDKSNLMVVLKQAWQTSLKRSSEITKVSKVWQYHNDNSFPNNPWMGNQKLKRFCQAFWHETEHFQQCALLQ